MKIQPVLRAMILSNIGKRYGCAQLKSRLTGSTSDPEESGETVGSEGEVVMRSTIPRRMF